MKGNKLLKANKRIKFDLTLLVAPFVTVVMLLVIYYIKGIYPFGTGTTVDFDCTYKIVPEYFYLHDAWHGGSLFYDFTTAGGFARDLTLSLLRPGNIFMLLFPRESIVGAMDYLLIFRMALVAFTASYSMKHLYPELPKPWVATTALMYTFCGYNLEYFTYIEWLEAVAVFPLVMLFAVEMFRGKSRLPFFFTLLYLILIDTYFSYFTIVGLIVFGGLYIFIVEDKSKRKADIFNLGVGTLGAMLAGGYQIYWFLINNFMTARFDMNLSQLSSNSSEMISDGTSVLPSAESLSESITESGGLLSILKQGFAANNIAYFMLLGAELAVASLILMWFRCKTHKEIRKHTVFFTVSFLLLTLQLFLRSSDLILHGGSQFSFPVRNGFILGFLCCSITGYYSSKLDKLDGLIVKNDAVRVLIPVFCAFSLIFVIPQLLVFKAQIGEDYYIFNKTKMMSYSFVRPFVVMFLAFTAAFVLFKLIKKKAVRSLFTIVLLLAYLAVNSFAFIGEAEASEKAERNNMFYGDCFDVRSLINDTDPLLRTCNPDLSLFVNYPYISGVSSFSNWTATLSQECMKAYESLGFSTYSTETVDSGGTAFSKSLLRINNTVSKTEQTEKLYSKQLSSQEGLNCYKNLIALPVGIVFDKNLADIEYDSLSNTFAYQNAIYQSLKSDGVLFSEPSVNWYNFTSYKKDKVIFDSVVGDYDVSVANIKLNVSNKQALYLMPKDDTGVCIYIIRVNGEQIDVPSGQEIYTQFSGFPQSTNNNILELGVFENEDVTLEFDFVEGSLDDISLYTLDLDRLQELCESFEENPYEVGSDWLNFTTHSDIDDGIIFLPIAYDKEWKCTVNGEAVEPVCVLGDFIGLPAQKGENKVEMRYSHRMGYIHIAAVVVMSAAAFGLMVLIKKKEDFVPRFVYGFTKLAFTAIFSAVMLILYVIPLIFAFYYM